MYPKLTGSPDILVYPSTLLFLDGCFWHCCPKCGRPPKSNLEYWAPKLQRNRKRDRTVTRELRRRGFTVLRVWEHSIQKSPATILRKLEVSVGSHRRASR